MIGVDFGTSTSLLAYRVGRSPVSVAPLGRTTRWFPSVAGFRGGTLLLGEDTDNLPTDQVIRSVKRAITRRQEVVSLPGPDGGHEVPVDYVITALLTEIVRRAESAGYPITMDQEYRLGCPAMWDGSQRQRLVDLASKAGLPMQTSTLIDEPIAAGIAWVRHRYLAHGERPRGRLLVFDMGGGTLDLAVLHVVGGDEPEISVLYATGDDHAGDLLDESIAEELTQELRQRGFDLDNSARPELFRALVLRAARDAKVNLSTVPEHRAVLPSILGQLPILGFSRAQLETALQPQMDRAEGLVWAALRAARLTERGDRSASELRRLPGEVLSKDIQYVLLAGGMSRIPYVGRRIGALFPHAQVFDDAGVAPDEAIVAGLADTAGYERLNLHRPGFDFVVEWPEAGTVRTEVLYHAYTPLYEPWQAMWRDFDFGYEVTSPEFPGPRDGTGVLRVRSTSGEYLSLELDRMQMDGVHLHFGANCSFKIYCDGRIRLQDAVKNLSVRVARWPVIRGAGHAKLVLTAAEGEAPPPPTAWYLEKEWAPPRR
jgi:molecular chaperone DnaK (HSP70)